LTWARKPRLRQRCQGHRNPERSARAFWSGIRNAEDLAETPEGGHDHQQKKIAKLKVEWRDASRPSRPASNPWRTPSSSAAPAIRPLRFAETALAGHFKKISEHYFSHRF